MIQEEHTAKDVEMEGLQKQLCESFTQWSQQSQLSVGFLMYLDKRIQADDYLSKVISLSFSAHFWSLLTSLGFKSFCLYLSTSIFSLTVSVTLPHYLPLPLPLPLPR